MMRVCLCVISLIKCSKNATFLFVFVQSKRSIFDVSSTKNQKVKKVKKKEKASFDFFLSPWVPRKISEILTSWERYL
jgi:hypothetical protein